MGFLSDPTALLQALGPWVLPGLAFVLFIESGCLFPFLPGDSLIFTAAMLHVGFGFSPWALVIVGVLASFAGVYCGYFLGDHFGRRFFTPEARILKSEYLERSERFFVRYGAVSLVLSRFVPIVRTFIPVAAGVARMNMRSFLVYNALGSIGWVVLMTIAGLALGQFPFVVNHLDVIVVVIVLVSLLPMLIAWLVERNKTKKHENEA
ncbi:MAG: DedA family protein [Actinomycetaceae bacterium]|nr:DedA family protein [Actinomycetaceae bacterium]MDY6082720.1 DedA family protein [Actinomycetaceae bacterium]